MLDRIKRHFESFNQELPLKESKNLTQRDLSYINSLSAAVVQTSPIRLRWVLFSFAITITLFIIWSAFAHVDEIARGSGKVVPSGQNQVVQNLEGGIISEILVVEGEIVKKDQILLRISNEKNLSTALSNELKADYFTAKIKRLEAELKRSEFIVSLGEDEALNEFLQNERELFSTNKKQLASKINILKDQISQKRSQLADAKQTIEHSRFSLDAIDKEVDMTRPMVERGIRSQVDFLKLQREQSDARQKLQSAKLSVERIEAEIAELNKKISETNEAYDSETRSKLNETYTQLRDIEANKIASSDQVERTIIKAPSNGIVQKLYVNTIGGSIKPAQELLEIVPTDHKLIVEVKILPKDIAFIYQDQKAIVKFSAFDFSIFGGLEGRVVGISPDTITEKDDKTFYIVRIETEKNYIQKDEIQKQIIPGMVADVDIITGKKSILDYILKPILKTKTYTFSER
ncbi:MAG: HlyD family type I secretion periplasmic adaptor subunit [Sulfuricurvum sp.]